MSTLQQLRNIMRAKVGRPQQYLLPGVRRIDNERYKCGAAAVENHIRRRYSVAASILTEVSLFPSQRNPLINLQSHRRISKKTAKSSRNAHDETQNTQKKYSNNDRHGSHYKRHVVEATHTEALSTKTKSRRNSSPSPPHKINTTASSHHEKSQHYNHHSSKIRNNNKNNNNNTSPLMSVCTKPSQLTSLHPAVRLALLHDEVKLEFRAVQRHEDPNIWY